MGLRIFAGNLKGTPLYSLKERSLRPTSGRVREAVFNILFHRVRSAVVLDLYAGTGALGLEALSRGARLAVFIDADPDAVSVLEKNIARCRVQERSQVIRWDINRNLNCLAGHPASFDLVFVDPPYHKGAVFSALKNLVECGVLEKGALVVVEHGVKESVQVPGFELTDQRKYGKTLVSFFRYGV
ncbi:MAG: 16S rRNA (guanine(966)-N(2))-methyltransferase RsmD [Deltaproteobacteria bacterium]|nr:16S rRNA (guanine(966)-N(2))-methyltransferase RsmD [Deltaproteobacteria bacterium]MBW2040984.1 16S rRNA (guanine(966)-N(2))-methyltransferase RsmD [Deltaproteobacteria bacterium]MBW2131289.1 16S rRNA (guanine(966)-N(2))-methyltransferase RsmD [Deltaproteobacteria bacterium]